MAHSTVVQRIDQDVGLHLRDEIYRIEKEVEKLNARREILLSIQAILRVCPVCGGSGTVCDGRTENDDMPIYNPCRGCGGKGHNR